MEVSNQEVEDFLTHYGVLGMKWGVRKDREVILTKTFKTGETLTVTKDPASPIAKALSKIFPKYKEHQEKISNFTLSDKQGKKIGDASFFKDSPTSLNLMWIGVKANQRGKGYATAVLEGVVNFAKQEKLEKLTLEVPGTSPDALHIYERLGFKTVSQVSDKDIWGGLTSMELELKTAKHSASIDQDTEDFLSHYGILGMKWGVRKAESQERIDRGDHTSPKDPKKVATESNSSSSSAPKKVKKPTSDEIKAARARQNLRQRKYEEAQGDFIVARTAKGQDKAEKIMRELEKDFFTNPDKEISERMTTGEKWMTGVNVAATLALTAGSIAVMAKSKF